jgi:hypothetical protein
LFGWKIIDFWRGVEVFWHRLDDKTIQVMEGIEMREGPVIIAELSKRVDRTQTPKIT